MIDRRLRRAARPLKRLTRAALQVWNGSRARHHADRILRDRGDWEIVHARKARSGVRIALARSRRDGTEAFLKLTDAIDGGPRLKREWRSILAVIGEPKIGEIRAMLPEPLDFGEVGGWSFLLLRARPGDPATPYLSNPVMSASIFSHAIAFTRTLHGSTAVERMLTQEELQEWIDRPLAIIESLLGTDGSSAEYHRLAELRREVYDAIGESSQRLGWIHGDFWSENLLVDSATGTLSGVVDWDSADHLGLAIHDPLHLVLYARGLRAGGELGAEVCRGLTDLSSWDPEEQAAIDLAAAAVAVSNASPHLRIAIILYWLRLVAVNMARQPQMTTSRRWVDDNVRAVIACR